MSLRPRVRAPHRRIVFCLCGFCWGVEMGWVVGGLSLLFRLFSIHLLKFFVACVCLFVLSLGVCAHMCVSVCAAPRARGRWVWGLSCSRLCDTTWRAPTRVRFPNMYFSLRRERESCDANGRGSAGPHKRQPAEHAKEKERHCKTSMGGGHARPEYANFRGVIVK